MPKSHFKFIKLLVLAVLVAAVLAGPAQAARKNVIIGGMTWTGSEAVEQIMKYVLEEKLGIPVEIKQLTAAVLWPAMDKGQADIYPDMWMPNQMDGWKKYVEERKSVVGKLSYDNAPQGIYMSAPLAKKYGIKSVFDLKDPEKAKIFDTNGNGLGEMWVGPYSWSASEINKSKIKEYGLKMEPLEVEQWAFLALLKEAMRKNKPLVFYYWEPEWPMAKYDLIRLEEPPYEESKWIHVKGKPDQTHVSCAYPPATVYVGVSKKLEKRLPKAYKFFMNWSIPIEEVSNLIADIEDVPGNPKKPAAEVAKAWVESHPQIVKGWLKGIE